MAKNSKLIGNDYERVVSRKLSEWLTGDKKEIVVWRNISSGSVSTIAKKSNIDGTALDGDFQYIGKEIQHKELFSYFFFDSKSLGNVHLMLINDKNKKSNQLLNEWKKVSKEAESSKKIPLMIVKSRNDRKIPELIFFPKELKIFYYNYMEFCIYNNVDINDYFRCMSLDEFFKLNNWSSLLEDNKEFLGVC